MTDKRSVEGSAERAADRGNDFGFSMDSRPSLGNADVVRGLMTEFGSDIVNVRIQYNSDKLDGEQAQARVRDLAASYGKIVMGQDDRYDAMPWNSPEHLGRRIKLVTAEVDGVSGPGELLFLTIGSSLMDLAAAHEAGRVSDSEAERHTKDMLEDTANLILGTR